VIRVEFERSFEQDHVQDPEFQDWVDRTREWVDQRFEGFHLPGVYPTGLEVPGGRIRVKAIYILEEDL
jgi:hypothetical protein